jgi:pimeloyl-ACP methyl ester carboxylesterase
VWTETFLELQTYDDTAELEDITVPTLPVWGDSDRLVTREMQDSLAECIRGADFCRSEGVGHTPRWAAPTRFATDVTAFFERCTGRRAWR